MSARWTMARKIATGCAFCRCGIEKFNYEVKRRKNLFCSLACAGAHRRELNAKSFWTRLEKTEGGCMVWTKSKNADGYGLLSWKSRADKAHRVAYELANGPIPEGMKVLHRCDNPPCCNPAHLFVGTQADNVKDCLSKGRAWHQRRQVTP